MGRVWVREERVCRGRDNLFAVEVNLKAVGLVDGIKYFQLLGASIFPEPSITWPVHLHTHPEKTNSFIVSLSFYWAFEGRGRDTWGCP